MQPHTYIVLAAFSVAMAVALLLSLQKGRWLAVGLARLGTPLPAARRREVPCSNAELRWRGAMRLCCLALLVLWLFGFQLALGLLLASTGLVCLAALRINTARALEASQRLVSQLPNHLERMAMLLSAGLPLLTCLQQASAAQRGDHMARQLRQVVNQVKAGDSVHRAMVDFANRCPNREIRLFCAAVQHAQQSGSSLADILYAQAQQRRDELFLKAEQQAMEIPVRLMLPLMLFIFPATLMVLAVVLSGKLMWQL